MSDRIAQALAKLFERHRIVFWYDAKLEFRADFESLTLSGVEKIEPVNNEFGLKYRMLREQPRQKFLIYHHGPQPEDLENWLLDVQLAHGEFRTDQAAVWLAELELGLEFTELTQNHTEFFRAGSRLESLKKMLQPDDTAGQIRLKMTAVCAGCDPRLDAVLENLLQELAGSISREQADDLFRALADDQDEKVKLIGRCHLDGFLWEQIARSYGYKSESPGLRDFVIELFKSCYAAGAEGQPKLTGDALVFLKRWKDSREFSGSFEVLSGECANVLGIEQDLARRDFRGLIELDYFRLIDQKIISDLVKAVATQMVSSGEVEQWVRRRRQGHWYHEFKHLYEAIDFAARFIQVLGEARLEMGSLTEGIQRYTRFWWQVDQLYRKFTHHVHKSGQATLLAALTDQIENLYSNSYLLTLGDRFQAFVEAAEKWEASPLSRQNEFFKRWVEPFLSKGHKVCVIISDALRYEIGEELQRLIRQEDRFSAELDPMLALLPSYTQLGMAALLPNTELAIADNDTGTVLVDGHSSQGTANRAKILAQAVKQRATAYRADELMNMKGDDCRALLRDHDLLYIYHNRIDAVGDKRESEERVFEAVDETLRDLIRLIKKLTGANASNLLVTSDHGFIYQNRPLDESDFSGSGAEGHKIFFRDRRFVVGKGLHDAPGLRQFTSAQLGLAGAVEVQIPKSINRLRLKGSGSRYVHGGATLQEVVLPVLKINKKRQSDVASVEVVILPGASSVITSGQLAVSLYQAEPVTDKIQPRTLRAGIYTEVGDLISDCHDLTFDLRSENPRERELQARFVFTRRADEVNGQEVILRLLERHGDTSHYKEYKSVRYVMRRSFTSDFDF
ncbi:MAG: BREX-1 system phosphatase PglZ type A [Candidatus Adiutrix sp.]|jgi:uncharacterized protein (TIGR02687 family)|nr:BREX-1 system phosphatase PglZ type A [Candidatus Adiutrix sp.]